MNPIYRTAYKYRYNNKIKGLCHELDDVYNSWVNYGYRGLYRKIRTFGEYIDYLKSLPQNINVKIL